MVKSKKWKQKPCHKVTEIRTQKPPSRGPNAANTLYPAALSLSHAHTLLTHSLSLLFLSYPLSSLFLFPFFSITPYQLAFFIQSVSFFEPFFPVHVSNILTHSFSFVHFSLHVLLQSCTFQQLPVHVWKAAHCDWLWSAPHSSNFQLVDCRAHRQEIRRILGPKNYPTTRVTPHKSQPTSLADVKQKTYQLSPS